MRALERFGYVLEAAGRKTGVRPIVDWFGAEDDGRLAVLVRFAGWLRPWVLKREKRRFKR